MLKLLLKFKFPIKKFLEFALGNCISLSPQKSLYLILKYAGLRFCF